MTLSGWIIYNGSLNSEKFIDFACMLQSAAHKQKMNAMIYKNNDIMSYLSLHPQIIQDKRKDLPDFVIFTDKDIYLAKQLELLGIRVFNRAKAIATSDDKIATYQRLAELQLPIPKTIVAPKSFTEKISSNFYQIDQIIERLGLPMIVKEAFGSFGEQVYLVNTKEELREMIQTIHGRPFMFQEFIETSYGRDLRLQVIGSQVVTAMKRTAKDDFRANITAGGTMEAYKPTKYEVDLAIKATKAIGADFAGVDLLFGENDEPIICEVNSNAHIRNIYECTNINPADAIISYIRKQLSTTGEQI